MKLFTRASRLLKANINHLLDTAEDPEVMVKQLLGEMQEAVTELRAETVKAIAREKQLDKKKTATEQRAAELESKAVLALEHENRPLARKLLDERLAALKSAESLGAELEQSRTLSRRLKADLARMQQQVDVARGRKDELIRRKRAAEAQLRTREAARRSHDALGAAASRVAGFGDGRAAFEGYADEIDAMEAEAQAARELAEERDGGAAELDELARKAEVDRELERLERKRASGS